MNDRLQRLEEKVAYLEHHVTGQDKAMLELGDEIRRLRRQLDLLRKRVGSAAVGEGDDLPTDERPPHY